MVTIQWPQTNGEDTIMAQHETTFYEILSKLISSDNEIRTQAEETYNEISKNKKLKLLVGAIHQQFLDEERRSTAAMLLRELVTSNIHELFRSLMFEESTQLSELLLACLLDEESLPTVPEGVILRGFTPDAVLVTYYFCSEHILTLYMEPLAIKLETILSAKFDELVERGTRQDLEQIVATITSVAETLRKDCPPCCADRLMPILKNIIQFCSTEALMRVRGKTIRCAILMGLAVGDEKFMRDETELINTVLNMYLNGEILPGIFMAQPSTLIQRICQKFGQQFVQYLPTVMESVMHKAADFDDVGDSYFYTTLARKETACRMLVCFARELKEGFGDYSQDVVKLMVPQLKWRCYRRKFDNEVHTITIAASSLTYLLECARYRGRQYVEDMWNYILPKLLKAIDAESMDAREVLMHLLNSLAKCIESMGAGCLSPVMMAELLRIISKITGMLLDFEGAAAVANAVFRGIANLLKALLSTYRDEFYPHLDTVLQNLVDLLSTDRTHYGREQAIRIISYVIKFGGPACFKYKDIFLEVLNTGVRDSEPVIRQAAVSGWGVIAQYGGEQFAGECAQALPKLIALIIEPGSRSYEKVTVTHIAICAVASILQFNYSQINRNNTIRLWLEWLPSVKESIKGRRYVFRGFLCQLAHADEGAEGYPDEAPRVFGLLCNLAAEEHVALATPDAQLRVLALFAHSFMRGLVPTDNPVYAQMEDNILRQLQMDHVELFLQLNMKMQQALMQFISA